MVAPTDLSCAWVPMARCQSLPPGHCWLALTQPACGRPLGTSAARKRRGKTITHCAHQMLHDKMAQKGVSGTRLVAISVNSYLLAGERSHVPGPPGGCRTSHATSVSMSGCASHQPAHCTAQYTDVIMPYLVATAQVMPHRSVAVLATSLLIALCNLQT